MEQLAAMDYRSSKEVHVQLVLLSLFAGDVTPETPAQQVGGVPSRGPATGRPTVAAQLVLHRLHLRQQEEAAGGHVG